MNVDPEVIARAIAGDEQAFAEIVGAFRRPVLSHIRHMLRDSDAAEDVWQDVQFRVWRNLHRFDQARKFSTWIFTIATPASWTIAACQRQLDDLDRQETPGFPFRYEPARGARVCRMLELLPHIKGRGRRRRSASSRGRSSS
jgi:DNA-directed RNA polymerase specialized sigma24 family protein